MQRVYALSAKGRRERQAAQPTLPPELGQLLGLVDGVRTGHDLLAAAGGKSAVTAGGLRWLTASGYVVATAQAEVRSPAQAQAQAQAQIALTAPDSGGHALADDSGPSSLPPSTTGGGVTLVASRRSARTLRARSDDEVCRILSDFMVQSIRRRLGDGGYTYRRQIERATSVGDLLPHLHPLIDAIVVRAGADAGAEFADTAAFILNPHGRDATLN